MVGIVKCSDGCKKRFDLITIKIKIVAEFVKRIILISQLHIDITEKHCRIVRYHGNSIAQKTTKGNVGKHFLDIFRALSYNVGNDTRSGNMKQNIDENLITAWVQLTGILKNTRITKGLVYNESIVMLTAYKKYIEDGEGLVSFQALVRETRMLKSLVNRTIDSLVTKKLLTRCEGKDKRTTFVRIIPENLGEFLAVHEQSLSLARRLREIIGDDDAEAFIRISQKIAAQYDA